MGGQMQQSNAAAATALYDNAGGGPLHNAGPASDAGDAVMARWLQSAGLQHLASPLASTGIDQRLLPNLLMQGYGAQSAEEKQRLFKLMRNLNFNGESGSEPYTPAAQTSAGMPVSDGFYSPDFRGDFGAGLLDLHAMDDTELLSEVRKRPLNKKEIARKEDDIVTVSDNALTVHEPKLKVDLTAYVEKHEFCFDAVLDQHVTNDEVYRVTVEPIIPIIFQRTKATCFAYGQTGSGKTFTMQPLPLRAAEDLVRLLHQPVYRNQRFKLWLSFFEIYGGKLFDLLSDRKKLCMREDGRQQVCIVGLQEFEVSDVQIVKEYIEKGNAARSTGSTGANEESSRSHAILQLAVKKHGEVKDSRRNNDGNDSKSGKVIGKISFIDLAGSERGADTTDNDRQTRIEGAEINKSLLALKECIRALDNDQIHIPFRGSKLTEVLRDSFVGNSRTVMISCISPNAGSCEHTLNTLRYADRVKSLSKGGNPRKDQNTNSLPPTNKDVSSSSSLPVFQDVDDVYEQQEVKPVDTGRRLVEKGTFSYNPTTDYDKQPPSFTSSYPLNGQEESMPSGSMDKERVEITNTYVVTEEKMQKVSPPRRKGSREEKTEKLGNWLKKDNIGSDLPLTNSRQQNSGNYPANNTGLRHFEPDPHSDEITNTYGGSTSQKVHSSSFQNYMDAEEKMQKVSPPRRKGSREEKTEKLGNWLKKDNIGSDLPLTNSRLQNPGNYPANNSGLRHFEPDTHSDEITNTYGGSTSQKVHSSSSQNYVDTEAKMQKVSPPRKKGSREEKTEKLGNWLKKDNIGSDLPPTNSRQQNPGNYPANNTGLRHFEPDPHSDGNIDAILEEEEALIKAHRKEIEDTMEIVREEMKLLAEVDQPGSLVDNYVTQLSFVLSRKAAGLVSLQARLARFQHRLKEQEILSRKRVPR
ncbi:hypothetical protein MANES_15G011900v8 [Manihot esculenta]|uniref:Uncharacterized protein n=1 Tax=Manihot esculenta TaxID=3983 RepID=A0ACB7GCX1_MANES|nr:hypothetical protein MANES_15G011900v8 [Manihot esculenta]